MWNEQLAALTKEYASAVLSIVELDGYPVSVRCIARLDASRQIFTFPAPPAEAMNWHGKACLLFHQFNERLEGLRQIVVLGELLCEGGVLTLQVSKFVTANGREDSDQMPHASSPIHMLQFFWFGRRKAHDYLAKRGTPWPPIPYEEIERLLADDERARSS